jgi:hypothetical protein
VQKAGNEAGVGHDNAIAISSSSYKMKDLAFLILFFFFFFFLKQMNVNSLHKDKIHQ